MALAVVQHISGVAGLSGLTSASATLNGCSSGNDLLIVVSSEDTAVSASATPSLTHIGTDYSPLGTGTIAFYTVHLSSGGNITVTATTPSASQAIAVWIFEVSGATSLVLDARGNTTGLQNDPIACSVTAAAGSLVLSNGLFYPGQSTGDSGWTFDKNNGFNGYTQCEWKVSSGATETASYNSATSGNGRFYHSVLAVKDSGAGGGSTYNDVIPAAGSPNALKVTCSQALANAVSFSNALSFSTTLSFAQTQVATFPRSLAMGPVTMGFSQSASNAISQSPSYAVTMGQSLAVSKASNPAISFSTTLSQSLANSAVFVNSMTQQVVLGTTIAIGFSDPLAFSVTLSQALATQKITSPSLSMAVTLTASLNNTAAMASAISYAVALAQSLSSNKITPATLSFTLSLLFTMQVVASNDLVENVMTYQAFGFYPMQTAALSSTASLSAGSVESQAVMNSGGIAGATK